MKTAEQPVIERRLSLWDVEHEKAELIALREELSDPAEIEAADKAIQEYIGREIKKVSGIAALLRYFRSHAEMAKAEKDRAAKWQQVWDGRYERLKNMVHGVMMALDLPKVEGATDRFRRQKNPVAVEITDAALIPDEYLKTTIKMAHQDWKAILRLLAKVAPTERCAAYSVTSEVDTVALKAALQTSIGCAACSGSGKVPLDAVESPELLLPCVVCEGTGQVPVTVPGARLKQGEHLRCE